MIERGPRHPLVLTILAIVVGVVAVFLASQLIRSDDDSSSGAGAIDPADVQVAILSATSEPGVGSEVADILEGRGFVIASVTSATDNQKQSGVFFAPGEKQKGKVVARALKLPLPSPFEAEQEAAADGADVVVIAGEDGRAAGDGSSGGDSKDDAATAPDGEG